MRGEGGGREAYGVVENPRGGFQGVGGGVELLQGIDTPGVGELPWGDETPGVATEGERVTGEDGRRRGGDGTPPTNQASKERGANGSNKDMERGPRTAESPRPQRDTAEDDDSVGPLPRQSDGTNSARPENGMHLLRKYGLMTPEQLEGVKPTQGPG